MEADNRGNERVHKRGSIAAAMTAVMTSVTCLGGIIRFPMPSPLLAITIQTFFACMAGVLLGPKLGALSQLAYVALGLSGVPVFSEGGGIMYVLKPSFGFLLGFPLGALVTGYMCRRFVKAPKPLNIMLCSLAGLAAIYVIGLPYLALILKLYLGRSWGVAVMYAVNTLLYITGDVATLIILALAAPQILKRVPSLKAVAGYGKADNINP